jgi:hypothetical protein
MLFGCLVAAPLSNTVGEYRLRKDNLSEGDICSRHFSHCRCLFLGRRMTSLLGVGVTFAVAYILVVTANHVSMVLFLVCCQHIEQGYICM